MEEYIISSIIASNTSICDHMGVLLYGFLSIYVEREIQWYEGPKIHAQKKYKQIEE